MFYRHWLSTSIQKCHYKAQQNQVRLTLKGTHQLLSYADNVNLMGENIDNWKKTTETLPDASKEVGLEVNEEEIKCMLLSRHQTIQQNYIKIDNRDFVNVVQLKYFGTAVTIQNVF
jgi:hypothetical protein